MFSRYDVVSYLYYRILQYLLQAWAKCVAKNWNLSYSCITSDAAQHTVLERIDEDPKFTLSVSDFYLLEGVEIPEDSENTYDHITDDTAVTTDELADALGLSESHVAAENSFRVFQTNEGDVEICGGVDDELTDEDAVGDPDPDFIEDFQANTTATDLDDSKNPEFKDTIDFTSDVVGSLPHNSDAEELVAVAEDIPALYIHSRCPVLFSGSEGAMGIESDIER